MGIGDASGRYLWWVQQFEGDYVTFTELLRLEGSALSFSGATRNGARIAPAKVLAFVRFYPLPQPIPASERGELGSHSLPPLLARVLPGIHAEPPEQSPEPRRASCTPGTTRGTPQVGKFPRQRGRRRIVSLALVGSRSMQTVTLSDHVQAQIDAVPAAVEQDRVRQQARYNADYEQAKRAAEEQQERYDAEYERATRAAVVQQEIQDSAYEDAKRAAAARDHEIEAVRQEASWAWSDRQFRRTLGLRIRVLFMRRAPKPKRRTVPAPGRQTSRKRERKVAKAHPSPHQEDELRRLQDSRPARAPG